MELLRRSKDTEVVEDLTDIGEGIVEDLQLRTSESGVAISRSQRINLAMDIIRRGVQFAKVVELLSWKDFEVFVAEVLTQNDYRCIESYRKRGSSETQGMEIDVVGVRGRQILSVDAKMWGVRGGKTSALRTAAERQKERCARLAQELNPLSKKISGLKAGFYTVFPAVVTWLVEEVELHEGVPVVPVFKLNSFLVNLHQYEDLIASYSGSFSATSP